MKCVTPMYRRYIKGDHKKGSVVSRAEAMQELEADHNNARFKLIEYNKRSSYYQYEQIPCKKCWACQLNYSAEWATRIMLEAKETPGENWFITLTYDDDHLPIAGEIETEEGTYENDGTWNGTLYEHDMVKFINSLRKYYENKGIKGIKYFYCGEYGETTGRPHFHLILLHCPLEIEKFHDVHVDTNFKAHWKSKQIENLWAEETTDLETNKVKRTPKGLVDIAELEWSCAAYVARYCTKKISFDRDRRVYYEQGKMPEFIRMSNGIGMEWYKKHKNEIYKNDELIMRTIKGNVGSMKPPKAFDRKFKEQFPEKFEIIKKSRETAAKRADKMLRKITDRTDYENLILNAEKVSSKMSLLPRVGEW